MVKKSKSKLPNQETPTKVKENKKKHISNAKRFKTKRRTDAKKNGLVYLGHVPHGFYEPEMREFFSQFGRVTATKLCRSARTGNSKGFGFVEFAQPEVAKIAAETMNNYLMFKKRMEAKYVPPEQRPKYLFEGRKMGFRKPTMGIELRQKRQSMSKTRGVNEKEILKRLSKKSEILKKRNVEISVEPVVVRRSSRNKVSESSI